MHELNAIVDYHPDPYGNPTHQLGQTFNISIGCPDLMHEMMVQVEKDWKLVMEEYDLDPVNEVSFGFKFDDGCEWHPTMGAKDSRKIRYAERAALEGKFDQFGEVWRSNARCVDRAFEDGRVDRTDRAYLNIELSLRDVAFVLDAAD